MEIDKEIGQLKADFNDIKKCISSKFARTHALLYTSLGALILNLILLILSRK